MLISVGLLPQTYPGASLQLLLDWARKADTGPFESLCALDVITGPNYDPIVALTAAAAVTTRIRLSTGIIVAPLRNPVLLAKQALSLNALSGGRFTLGIAAGYREKDFQACEVDFHQRGKLMDKALETITKIWDGELLGEGPQAVGPLSSRPGLMIGGAAPAAIKRIGRYGDGYLAIANPPESCLENYAIIEKAWKENGRPGKPRLGNGAYCAFGPDAKERVRYHFETYYSDFPQATEYFLSVLCDTDEAVREFIKANEQVGVDELTFMPLIPELDQLDHLASLVS